MIHLKPIKPKRMRIPGIKTRMINVMRKTGMEQRKLFYKTTATWKGKRPIFKTKYKATPERLSIETKPDYRTKAGKKWRYLNEGTRIRWAVMSRDFKRKTRPRYVTSYRGAGGAVIVGRRAMQARGIAPRPGIEAREWTVVISERTGKKFITAIRKEFKIHAENLYGSDSE